MSSYSVVLDTCVLVPVSLCDTLLRAAARDLYRLWWSQHVFDELTRVLIRTGLTTIAAAQYREMQMKQAFPEALVTGYETHIASLLCDPKDRPVLATAVQAGVQYLVTFNVKDFPASACTPYGVEVRLPDEFLSDLYAWYPESMANIVVAQAVALRNPPSTVVDVLSALAQHVPHFASLIRSHLNLKEQHDAGTDDSIPTAQ